MLGNVDLLLVDEIHHISEDRGATLETIVIRMKIISENYQMQLKTESNTQFCNKKMRIIALSATLPNIVDIGEWINCSPDSIHYFDDTYRPIPLTVKTIGI